MVVASFSMGKTQKVVVCGARGCGKTSILEKVIYDNNGVGSINFLSFFNIYKILNFVAIFFHIRRCLRCQYRN